MRNLRFITNALWLTATGFILRGLGMLLRVYISSKIGEEGMGLYQLVSSAYFLFITLAQSGLPVAVTRLCAKRLALNDERGAYAVLRRAVFLALCTGFVSMLAMLSLSGVLAEMWMADTRTAPALRVLSLSLPFIAVCNVLSAYNTALRRVNIGCIAQLIEQTVRMSAVVLAAYIFVNKGITTALCAVFCANTISEAVSCLFLSVFNIGEKRRYGKPKNESTREIVSNAFPVALSRYLASGLRTAENMLVPSALALSVGDRSGALSEFGALKGMAIPLMFFPYSFLSAFSTLLVPEITEASVRKDRHQMNLIINRTFFFTISFSAMIMGVFILFYMPLGKMIYNSERVSLLLLKLAPIIPFMYLDSVCDGLLKGLGLQKRVLYHGSIDSGIRIILIALLVSKYGMNGFVGVMIFSNIFIATLNSRLLLKTTAVRFNFKAWVVYPTLCTGASAIVTRFLVKSSTTLTKTVFGCALFCAVFMFLMLIFYRKNIICKIK